MLLMTQAMTVKYSLVVMLPLFVKVENDSLLTDYCISTTGHCLSKCHSTSAASKRSNLFLNFTQSVSSTSNYNTSPHFPSAFSGSRL